MLIYICLILFFVTISVGDKMIQTRWSIKLTNANAHNFTRFQNYIYENTPIKIYGSCNSEMSMQTDILWIFLQMKCVEDIYAPVSTQTLNLISTIITNQDFSKVKLSTDVINNEKANNFYFQFEQAKFNCDGDFNILSNNQEQFYEVIYDDKGKYEVYGHFHQKTNLSSSILTRSWGSGIYSVFLKMKSNGSYTSQVNVDMPMQHGFLTISDYPLLPFAGVMSICYLLISTIWIVVWVRAQEHTRKVHVFIGISTVGGGFAYTFTFAAYSMANTDGLETLGIQLMGAGVGEIQMVLTIILLMGISTGYAINRPNLSRLSVVLISLISISYLLSDLMLIIINILIHLNPTLLFLVAKYVYIWKASSMTIILIWIGLCSLSTLSQLYMRGHSGKSKLKEFIVLVVFSIFSFLTHLVYTVYLSITLFNDDCHQNLNIQWALPCAHQIYIFVLLTTLMWLWRPLDDKKAYAFQPIKHMEEGEELMDDDDKDDYKLEEL